MKIQINRFPVHQNAKVFAVMMAIVSFVFVIPFFFIVSAFGLALATVARTFAQDGALRAQTTPAPQVTATAT